MKSVALKPLKPMAFFPSFKGTVIHDHWTPYFKYDDCTHALCNVHHLREFKGIIDFENQQWAKNMTKLLLEAKTYSEETEYPYPYLKYRSLRNDTNKSSKRVTVRIL